VIQWSAPLRDNPMKVAEFSRQVSLSTAIFACDYQIFLMILRKRSSPPTAIRLELGKKLDDYGFKYAFSKRLAPRLPHFVVAHF
jgi:hypothetical protein